MKRCLAGVFVLVVVAVLTFVLSNMEQPAKFRTPANKVNNTNSAEKPVASSIKSDEEVVFYPTMGWPVDASEQAEWEIEIHGSIYEPGNVAAGIQLVRQLTGIGEEQLSTEEARLFQQRAEAFAVDNERDKQLPIRIGERIHTLAPSDANGHFQTRLRLSHADVVAASGGQLRQLTLSAVLPNRDRRHITGTVHLMPQGRRLHVVTDIDDTIKISEVRDKPALLKNTFCRPFQEVPGMAELYQRWAANDIRFHYVSASPWQLFAALAEFIRDKNFPSGTLYLKLFRIKDRTATNLLGSQEQYKREVIEPLLKRFPSDQFVLVGDSGEQDAKIYAGLARDYPQQIQFIFIRNVTDESLDEFRETFAGVADDRWQVFLQPAEITKSLSLSLKDRGATSVDSKNSSNQTPGDHQP